MAFSLQNSSKASSSKINPSKGDLSNVGRQKSPHEKYELGITGSADKPRSHVQPARTSTSSNQTLARLWCPICASRAGLLLVT